MCVCPYPRLLNTSDVIWIWECEVLEGIIGKSLSILGSGLAHISYDRLNKFYNCYMATVVVIVNGRGLGISVCGRH